MVGLGALEHLSVLPPQQTLSPFLPWLLGSSVPNLKLSDSCSAIPRTFQGCVLLPLGFPLALMPYSHLYLFVYILILKYLKFPGEELAYKTKMTFLELWWALPCPHPGSCTAVMPTRPRPTLERFCRLSRCRHTLPSASQLSEGVLISSSPPGLFSR